MFLLNQLKLRSALASCLMASLLTSTTIASDSLPGVRVQQMDADFSAKPFDRNAALARRAEVHHWLLSNAVIDGLDKPVMANVSSQQKTEIDNASGEKPPRVGLTQSVGADFNFSDVNLPPLRGRSLAHSGGAIQASPNGGFTFTTAMSSPGAAAMKLQFTGFSLPPQTGLYLYNEQGEVFGPYTGRGPGGTGQFWSHTVSGDFVVIQLHHMGQATADVLKRSGFTIARASHLRPRLKMGFCGFNETCVENAACGTDNAVTDAKDAVADMLYISGAFAYICTGGLLRDTDDSSDIPHFLTANHCISKSGEASSLETFFGFTAPCGTSDCPDFETVPQDQRTLGATISSTGRRSDYTLLRLAEPAPAGSAFLGWNSTPVANANGTELFRISHPSGAPQAYSEHMVDTSKGTCRSWPRGRWIYSKDTFGATEGGSSGSPVLNASGQVVGQLTGGCGTDVQNVCNSDANATVDGAFAAYFDNVSTFLDPDGGTSCSVEICDDGIDNDCDSFIDDNDPDCDGGSGGLGKGEACVADNECQSLNCRGKPGAKTCK